ncbi:MAG: hypothetical protein NVS3B7_06410 [Candidatus Elarobacter sp.]
MNVCGALPAPANAIALGEIATDPVVTGPTGVNVTGVEPPPPPPHAATESASADADKNERKANDIWRSSGSA